MLDRRPARVTGRQVPPLHLRRGSGSGAIFKELPTNSADEAASVMTHYIGRYCEVGKRFQSPLIGASVMTPTLKHGVISELYKGFCEHPGKNGCREKQDRVGMAQSPSQPIETKRETHIRASPPSGPDPAGRQVSLFSAGRRDAPRGLLMPVSCPHFLPFSNPS